MLRLLALPAAVLLPQPAPACPVGLGLGFELVSSDGSRTWITPAEAPGQFRERVIYDDGSGYSMQGYFGVYTLNTVNFDALGEDDGTREDALFSAPPPLPEPGQRIDGVVAQVTLNGAQFERRHDLVAGEPADLMVGDCAFGGFPINLTVDDIDGPRRLALFYLVPLGVAVFVGYEDAYGAERYDLLAIEPLTPETASNP